MVRLEQLSALERASLHLSILKSLREFDRIELEPTAHGLIAATRREQCLLYLYLRAQRNIDSLLDLQHTAHFQAVAMLSRSIFELCVDVILFELTPHSERLMLAYKDLEMLRAARTIVAYEDKHEPHDASKPLSIRRKFISERSAEIEATAQTLWQKKVSNIGHWTGENLKVRCERAGADFEGLYLNTYKQFSWQVHPGLQGVFDATSDHVVAVYALAMSLAAMSYHYILPAIARELLLTKADDRFERKLKHAFELPFTDSEEDERALLRNNGLA